MTNMEKRFMEFVKAHAAITPISATNDTVDHGNRMYLLGVFHASMYVLTDPECKYRIKALARRFDMAAVL